jgi:hypothetical protein
MGLPRRHPLASPAVICAAVGALVVCPAWVAQQQRPRPAASPAPAGRTVPIAAAALPPGQATAPEPTGAADAGPPVDGGAGRDNPFDPVALPAASDADAAQADTPRPAEAAAAAEIQAAVNTAAPGLGRENPFDPLAATAQNRSGASNPGNAPGTARASGNAVPRPAFRRPMLPLPPVPPLDPGTLPPEGGGGPPATTGLRLVGFVTGRTVLAVIEDGGHSYLAAPGDLIRPGLRVAAVDAARQIVRLEWHGRPMVLSAAFPVQP